MSEERGIGYQSEDSSDVEAGESPVITKDGECGGPPVVTTKTGKGESARENRPVPPTAASR